MRRILVVIDMQNDFVDGSLGSKEAVAVVKPIMQKVSEYKNCKIYFTRDTHEANYLDTQEGHNLPVVHCVRDTEGWKINDKIWKAATAVTSDIVLVDKPSFGSLKLAELIYEDVRNEVAEVELVGVCTDICVVSNALLLKARMPELPICVDVNCVAGVTPKSNQAALTTMASCQIKLTGQE